MIRQQVNRMQDMAAHDLAVMGASIERISPHSSIGDCIRARFAHPKSDQPGILIIGHMDTVHPLGTLQNCRLNETATAAMAPAFAT
jgi:glutamate carboxypeptidase